MLLDALTFVIFLHNQSATPKKNAAANGTKGSTSQQVLADSDQVNAPVVHDLWLEAKLSAEVSAFGFASLEFT